MDKKLSQIIDAHCVKSRDPGFGITTIELSKQKGIGICSARRLLVKLVDEGLLKAERMNYAGKIYVVYYAD